MTVERMVELLEIEKECVLRNASGECNRYCAGCDLLQDDTELLEMYTEAIALLKAQEPVFAFKLQSKKFIGCTGIAYDGSCGNCNGYLMRAWRACPLCGKVIKWK